MLEALRRGDRSAFTAAASCGRPGACTPHPPRHEVIPAVHVRIEEVHGLLPRRVVPEHHVTMRVDQPRNHRHAKQSTTTSARAAPVREDASLGSNAPVLRRESSRLQARAPPECRSLPHRCSPNPRSPLGRLRRDAGRVARLMGGASGRGRGRRTRSRHAATDKARPGWSQPPRSSARVPRGRLDPSRARWPRPSGCRKAHATSVLAEAAIDHGLA